MAAAKKTRKKHASPKKTSRKKARPVQKIVGKRLAKRKAAAKKKLATKRPAVETKVLGKKRSDAKTEGTVKRRARRQKQTLDADQFAVQKARSWSAGQAGDLQGLSNVESADSESVEELIEEGNAFEADAVAGVEHARDADEKEVHTHEVPEDDVPGEYLDKD